MTKEEPLYVFQTSVLHSDIFKVRICMCLSALFLAVMAVVLKLMLDVAPLVFYLLLAVAVMDVAMSVILPVLLSKPKGVALKVSQSGVALYRSGREVWTVPYDDITALEIDPDMSEKDVAAGFVNLVLSFDPPLHFRGIKLPQLKLKGFAAADDPYGHIQPLLSK